jgi:hypothetical protein
MSEYILLYFFTVVSCWAYIVFNIVTSQWFDDFVFYSVLILKFGFVIACWLAMFGTHSFYIEWTMNNKTYNVVLNSIFN